MNTLIRKIFRKPNRHVSKDSVALKQALAEAISDTAVDNGEHDQKTAEHQRLLLANVLKLKDLTAFDVMVPRADIVAIDAETQIELVMNLLSKRQYSRLPVYRETLDDVVGTVHIKDILSKVASKEPFTLTELMRDVNVISPAMPVLDLLLFMRQTRRHMVLVVDEFGGIDGLVTINDIVETIVGEIDDEYDDGQSPALFERGDGTWVADGRYDLNDLSARFGNTFFNEDELKDNDTLAGLVVSIAGRVPSRGEVISHESGLEFEVLEADPRRVSRIRLRNVPTA